MLKVLVNYLYRISVTLPENILLHKLRMSHIFTTPNYEKNHHKPTKKNPP